MQPADATITNTTGVVEHIGVIMVQIPEEAEYDLIRAPRGNSKTEVRVFPTFGNAFSWWGAAWTSNRRRGRAPA